MAATSWYSWAIKGKQYGEGYSLEQKGVNLSSPRASFHSMESKIIPIKVLDRRRSLGMLTQPTPNHHLLREWKQGTTKNTSTGSMQAPPMRPNPGTISTITHLVNLHRSIQKPSLKPLQIPPMGRPTGIAVAQPAKIKDDGKYPVAACWGRCFYSFIFGRHQSFIHIRQLTGAAPLSLARLPPPGQSIRC